MAELLHQLFSNTKLKPAAVVLAAALLFAPPAAAEDGIFVPLFTYRTGPFSSSGNTVANGMRDFFSLLNERDGGIGGVKLIVEECETGYDNNKGIACYEAVKDRKPVVVNPFSTGIALALIPRAAADKIPILSMAYGLSASARGSTFPWIFNPPVTYWDGVSMMLSHIGSEVGGMRRLKGMKVGYLYLDSGYGREPIPFLEQLAKDFRFELKLYAVGPKDVRSQAPIWLEVARDKPDYMIMFGWGAMNPTAVQEAIKNKYPMARFFSIWWIAETDLRSAGEGANGFKTLNFHNVGQSFPLMQDILKYVVDGGKSRVASRDEVGELLYNRGVYNGMLVSEAIRGAQKLSGRTKVSAEDMRRGLESLDIGEARLKAIGLDGFTEPIRLSCSDHNGHHPTYIQQWHGSKWLKISGRIFPMIERLQPMLDAATNDFMEKNSPWPARKEACDARS